MAKKQPGKTRKPAAKPQKKQMVSKRVLVMKNNAKPQKSTPPPPDPAFTQAVQYYQDGLRALQERKFERAKSLFLKVANGQVRELADRAAVHLNACNQYLERSSTTFKTPEEHYDFAVSLLNEGEYVGAREHLDKLLKQAPNADYVYYGFAVLHCLTSHIEECLRSLAEAIRLNPNNRFQARNDSDFNSMADDPRFTELLYPENPEPQSPASRATR
jgi:tetratricopeptide (TPR) repeat protein